MIILVSCYVMAHGVLLLKTWQLLDVAPCRCDQCTACVSTNLGDVSHIWSGCDQLSLRGFVSVVTGRVQLFVEGQLPCCKYMLCLVAYMLMVLPCVASNVWQI